MTTTDVGTRIERARVAAGLSQRTLADTTGISQSTLSRVISGQRAAKLPELVAVAWATGVTVSELQSAIGKYPIPGTANVALINPKYLPSSGGGYITPNTTAGTFGQRVWLHGPHNTYDDISIAKHFPITEKYRFTLQAEMLNAFNHPDFGATPTNGGANFGYNAVQGTNFGLSGNTQNPQNSPNGGARIIELRANFEF